MNLQSFEYYLKESGLRESTIQGHLQDIKHFANWAKENRLTDITQINYNEILRYVEYRKNKKLSIHTVNVGLNSLRKYYEHLKEEGKIEKNPTRKLYIKGEVKKVVHDPLSYTELETLYNQYMHYLKEKPIREKKQEQTNLRKKVVIGLMIEQGAHSGEIQKIETTHVNLSTGIIYIPGTGRSNGRDLKLSTSQIIPLHEYLNTLPATQIKLINCRSIDLIASIIEEVKGINPIIKNAQHIRASVILHWIKMYDKRQVQYRIGHKWIGSTERYQVQDMEGLTGHLLKHHPFS